ncbi:MAG: leucine-rich repeat domain-containing protein, partial [Leptospiraceae bacterium]|nr:leucine-rich repeat domain-containing protein [Leptospiraceae bacterium]
LEKIEEVREKKLTELNLRGEELTEVPPEVFELDWLEILDLSNNQIKVIPEDIRKLKNLKIWNIIDNPIEEICSHPGLILNISMYLKLKSQIEPKHVWGIGEENFEGTEIPEEIRELRELEMLGIGSGKNLSEFPEFLCELKELKFLMLSETKIDSLPESIGKLDKLLTLEITNSQVKSIPDSIGELVNLGGANLTEEERKSLPEELLEAMGLSFKGNQISELPESIAKLTNLTTLNLGGNQLTEVPEWISQLTNLTSLYLRSNQLTEVPEFIGKLTNLTSLYLSNNQLSEIPESIGQLTNLTELYLGGNQLREIPEVISKLTNLTTLYLSDNQLKEIPEVISRLTNLTSLHLGSNQLTEVPESIKGLNLNKLELSKNKIKHLPRVFMNMPLELYYTEDFWGIDKGINLYGNPLINPMPEIIMQGREALVEYFEARERGEVLPLNEAKLIIVGDGAAGKTSLVKRILGQGFDKDESQTQGINISDWQLDVEDELVRLHIWDFGGQEIMHATHQFFLSDRCIYLVVLDNRKDEKAEYWLKQIDTNSSKSPVFIALNKIDENPDIDADRKKLKEKYKNIRGFFPTSCKTNTGIRELADAIQQELEDTEILHTFWPKSWFQVKQALNESTRDYISDETYREICEKEGINWESGQRVLLNFLHDLGVFLHFDSISLTDTHVINPRWITDAVYTIITSKKANDCEGKLNTALLQEILDSKRYPKSKHRYILDLMKEFELCYYISNDAILIPGLLPEAEPEFEFDKEGSLRFVFDYKEHLPPTIIPRFMVKSHKDTKISWRSGVVLEYEEYKTRALVRFDRYDKKGYVYVNGERKREYFSTIWKTFSEIHKSFENLDYDELI